MTAKREVPDHVWKSRANNLIVSYFSSKFHNTGLYFYFILLLNAHWLVTHYLTPNREQVPWPIRLLRFDKTWAAQSYLVSNVRQLQRLLFLTLSATFSLCGYFYIRSSWVILPQHSNKRKNALKMSLIVFSKLSKVLLFINSLRLFRCSTPSPYFACFN